MWAPIPALSSALGREQRPKDQGRKQLPVPDQSAEGPRAEPFAHSVRMLYTSLRSGCWGKGNRTIPALLMLIVYQG